MKLNKFKRTTFILLILALNIGFDQVTKALVRNHMEYYDLKFYLGHSILLTRIENHGAFLSLGDTLFGPLRYLLLNILPLMAILYGLYYIFKKTTLENITLVAIILIIGGGVGNLYDRLAHGAVTDFLQIDFILFKTGVFNVADMSIMAGTFMILFHAWFKKKPAEKVKHVEEPES